MIILIYDQVLCYEIDIVELEYDITVHAVLVECEWMVSRHVSHCVIGWKLSCICIVTSWSGRQHRKVVFLSIFWW